MGSAVSFIVIKSDFFPKRVPAQGQIVRVIGEPGSFVVMEVDRNRQMVQLMERWGRHHLIDVPLGSVRIFNRSLVHALRRFLDAREEAETTEPSKKG